MEEFLSSPPSPPPSLKSLANTYLLFCCCCQIMDFHWIFSSALKFLIYFYQDGKFFLNQVEILLLLLFPPALMHFYTLR